MRTTSGHLKILGFSLFFLLFSCARVEPITTPTPMITATSVQSPAVESSVLAENLGQQVARHINARYNNVASNCGSNSMPAFLCNGVMIRGTAIAPNYHVWNNSKASKDKGGVSFAYLRKDSNFRQMPFSYNNGFIFQSYAHVPAKLHPEVLCSYPIDGYTDGRAKSGCGAYPGFAQSQPCAEKGIVTLAQWRAHFQALTGSKFKGQCSFDVRDSRNTLAGPAFDTSIKARQYLGADTVYQNEIIVKAWADNLGKTLPLEAFFYLYGTTGKAVAQRNQRDLKQTDGILIPIISIRLARTEADVATFYFLPEDQTEAMPPARR